MIKVVRGVLNLRPKHKHCVVTIGNFDGVHTGHQAILRQVRDKAAELGTRSMLVCFEPQPREFFDVYNAPARLTRFREKVELLAVFGVDLVLCFKFNEKTRSMTVAEFVDILVKDLAVAALYVGDDFRFGSNREGSFGDLAAAGRQHGFPVTDIYTLVYASSRVSSTRIRECLAAGDFDLAEQLLGHPYSISGKVVYGRKLGRKLGVPTANIQLHRYVAPISGVFAVEMQIGDRTARGVANVGVRPTVDETTTKPVLEVHLFDCSENIYGRTVKVTFRHKIRDEKKFPGMGELRQAIFDDIDHAKGFFEG